MKVMGESKFLVIVEYNVKTSKILAYYDKKEHLVSTAFDIKVRRKEALEKIHVSKSATGVLRLIIAPSSKGKVKLWGDRVVKLITVE